MELMAKNIDEYKLCYIEKDWAYFTNIPIEEQWGDDWDDSPYEHNAGTPYSDKEDQIIIIAFNSNNYYSPCSFSANTNFSVEFINSGKVAWLSKPEWVRKNLSPIMAGEKIKDFISKIKNSGGEVYIPTSIL